MKTSSLPKKDDRGYATANAIRRTSIGSCHDDVQRSCASATGVPLNRTNKIPARQRNGMRGNFIRFAGFLMRVPGSRSATPAGLRLQSGDYSPLEAVNCEQIVNISGRR